MITLHVVYSICVSVHCYNNIHKSLCYFDDSLTLSIHRSDSSSLHHSEKGRNLISQLDINVVIACIVCIARVLAYTVHICIHIYIAMQGCILVFDLKTSSGRLTVKVLLGLCLLPLPVLGYRLYTVRGQVRSEAVLLEIDTDK